MSHSKLTADEFADVWRKARGSPVAVAKMTGLNISNVYARRARLAKRGVILETAPSGHGRAYGWQVQQEPYRASLDYEVRDGVAIIFGDAHYWPGPSSLAHRALLILTKRLKPKFIAANGDVFDGANISRHEPMGWVKLPTVIEELDTVKTRLGEIERAAPKAQRYCSPGNHCTRFDRRLATEVAEFAGVPGMRIEDHLRAWPMAYVAVLNRNVSPVLIMHNFRGGVHATWNNVLHAGATIVTGHMHAQDRKAHTSYFDTKYGIDHGCLADPDGPQFSYTMGRPKNWRSGFCVLTFDAQGHHYPPEFCEVQKLGTRKRATFRGETVLEE